MPHDDDDDDHLAYHLPLVIKMKILALMFCLIVVPSMITFFYCLYKERRDRKKLIKNAILGDVENGGSHFSKRDTFYNRVVLKLKEEKMRKEENILNQKEEVTYHMNDIDDCQSTNNYHHDDSNLTS